MNSHYPEIDAVVGVASGGIGWAMTLANCKLLPVLYARRDAKDHGLLNQIEGELPKDGAKVVVLDDVITTGRSALSVCEALQRGKNGKKAEVLGVFTVFDWDFSVVNKQFEEAGLYFCYLKIMGVLLWMKKRLLSCSYSFLRLSSH